MTCDVADGFDCRDDECEQGRDYCQQPPRELPLHKAYTTCARTSHARSTGRERREGRLYGAAWHLRTLTKPNYSKCVSEFGSMLYTNRERVGVCVCVRARVRA